MALSGEGVKLMSMLFKNLKVVHRTLLGCLILTSITACSDMLSTPSIPDGTQSPSAYHSRQGGFELTKAAVNLFRTSWVQVVLRSGLLTDELSSSSESAEMSDIRVLPELSSGTSGYYERIEYQNLHKLRGQAQLARAILAEYAPDEPAVRGQLFALEGYAVILLADLFCSGVPLSSVDFGGDYTYHSPSTTEEMYEHAITLFDSAIAASVDSADIVTLARVGKGRALTALSRYNDAASAVSVVGVAETYRTRAAFRTHPTAVQNLFAQVATVSDQEGINGLPFISSGDPRTASDPVNIQTASSNFRVVNFPNKYHPTDTAWFRIASGIEARLIEAEAALNNEEYDQWLQVLNQLRTDGTYRVDTINSIEIDTVWNAGTGGFEDLGPLTDPGDNAGRIRLLFSERASWLFLEAQRQGDMRRYIRQYAMDREAVYPTGEYLNGVSTTGLYGTDITVPIPPEEHRNPLFQGCMNRD